MRGLNRARWTACALSVAVAVGAAPDAARAQRFGGEFGAAFGFWGAYIDPGIGPSRSFGRDLGQVAALGGRLFLQTGRVRLGAGAFGGGFTDEGANPGGFDVSGHLSAGGFTAEYLVVQQNVELAIGGMAGGGRLTIEELQDVTGDVETVVRRRHSIFVVYPWARLGYNPATLVNVGLELGYVAGSRGVGGFGVSLDVMVGLIP